MEYRLIQTNSLKTALLAVCFAFSFSAFAAEAWVSVPSAITSNSKQLMITGGALSAGEAISVQVTDAAGRSHSRSAFASMDGKLNVPITPNVPGMHKVDVKNAAGKRIGGGTFLYAP